ncbi:hypothetical protein EW145_g1350 [Phellinidium pouzarii]|uniref:Amidohydrolase-related domain-containing protein n=1 Tax=Phellinidium pouzarii TaxID=167371 RepID=A0A4S4LFH5_9AGAM|nr:hypothetical protein EW145_g1350 [Phellinidium pouzarii]
MDASRKTALQPLALHNKQRSPNHLARLGRVLLVLCIAIQTCAFLPGLLRQLTDAFTGALLHSLAEDKPAGKLLNPADEWRDDVFPLRRPAPWDISTDFPYPRTLEFNVNEGTWLRLDVHPLSGEIVFDMLGDIYCLPVSSYLQPANSGPAELTSTEALPIMLGIPHDSDPHFSPDGRLLVFRSDAELGVDNIWLTNWTNCESMNVRPPANGNAELSNELSEALSMQNQEDDLLASGIAETSERKRRRLLREGRLTGQCIVLLTLEMHILISIEAQRITNETYRWISDARFHPSGSKVVATKWYTSSRSVPAGEGWEYTLPNPGIQVGSDSGCRIVGRSLPIGWTAEKYGDQQVGPEQFIWHGEDAVIYAMNIIDKDGQYNYDKDVHSGIYSIFEFNTTTKKTEVIVRSSPGGASRPELSRDGRTLAFVRRVRDKEALVLKDLKSGTIRNIWYGLTYDLAGISAPMGTYPSFSFTPDDSAIIIWAAGKLWNVPLLTTTVGEKVAGENPRVIPFTAHIKKRLAETLTASTDLLSLETAGAQRLHAFFDLSVNDAGTRVVFQGAGASYYLDFDPASVAEAKTPKKVSTLRPNEAYYSPSFVPGNGDLLIHTHWSDRNYSTFELADLSTGDAYELSGLPLGRYISPVLCSCTGKSRQIAFIKVASDYLSGNLIATANPGLYIGEITLPGTFTSSGVSISVKNVRMLRSEINTNERMTLKFLDGNKKLLVQQIDRAFVIDLAEGPNSVGDYNHTTVVEGFMTSEIAVPVQQDKVAFVDAFNVFVVNSKDVGDKPLWSKPGNATKGIARVGLDGGHDLQWSADGNRLFWFLGPYLHSLEVSRLSKCSSEIQNDDVRFGVDCIKNLLDIQEIKVSYPTDIARLKEDARTAALARGLDTTNSDVFYITHANVLSMVSGTLSDDYIRNTTIVIRGGVIESVGHASEIIIPQDANVLNARGGLVIPGFIDVHAHWNAYGNLFPARSWELEAFLAYGVTTLHNPSSDNVHGFVERARVESGAMVGPRIFHTGDIIYGAGAGSIHNDVADLDDARSALIRIKVEGGPASFSYKNYNQYSRASRQRLLLEARNLSMICVPEGTGISRISSTASHNRSLRRKYVFADIVFLRKGMTTVEHSLPIPELYEDVLTLYALSGTGATPTHIVNYGGTMGEQYVWANVNVANDPKLRRFTRHDILESVIETTHRPIDSFQVFNTSASIAKMVKKGLRTHIGAHGEPPLGLMFHKELAFTKAGGLSTYEALRAATRDAAITLGIDRSVGSLAPGMLADLLIYFHADVLGGSIEESKNLEYIMRGGRLWHAETMVEEYPLRGRPFMPIINAD